MDGAELIIAKNEIRPIEGNPWKMRKASEFQSLVRGGVGPITRG